MDLMLSEFTKGGYWSLSSLREDQEALAQGIGMIIGTEITGGEVAAGAEIGMTGMVTVAGIEITIIAAGATAGAQTTARMMAEEDMMMRGGAAAVLMEVLLLVEPALVQGEALHPGDLLGVKVLIDVFVKSGLLFQGVSLHVVDQLIHAASLLLSLMEINWRGMMKRSLIEALLECITVDNLLPVRVYGSLLDSN